MIEVATAVAVQTTKDLQEDNKELKESVKLIKWLKDELKARDDWKSASVLDSRVNKFLKRYEEQCLNKECRISE